MSFPTMCALSTHLIHQLSQAVSPRLLCPFADRGPRRAPAQALTMSQGDLHLLSRLIPPP